MNSPVAMALSGTTLQTLFVSQSVGTRVTSYYLGDGITDGENAVNVLGQANFTDATTLVTQAGMSSPAGVSYDSTNKKLYVAQSNGRRITVYNLANGLTNGENAMNILCQASYTATVSTTSQEGCFSPNAVLADPAHDRLYVLDGGNNRLVTYPTNPGIANGENAVNVLGQTTFTTATAATTQAGMNLAFDLALSGTTLQTLFVAQSTANRVTAYDVTSITDGENAVKVLGQTTFTATTAATTQAGMNSPRGVAYDPATKMLYVPQITAHRVTVYNLGDGITDGENAVKVLGQPSFTGANNNVTQSGITSPAGAYVDSANSRLYVPQTSSHRISIFDIASITDGEGAVEVLGQTNDSLNPPGMVFTKGAADNGAYTWGLNSPLGIAVDPVNHRLFVSDSNNSRILVYNLSAGNAVTDRTPDNVLGQPNFSTNTALTTQTGLSTPTGLYFDAVNNKLYVADTFGSRIVVYDTASITDNENAVDVVGQAHFLSASARASQVGFSAPRHMEYDAATGLLFVVDTNNNRVMIFDMIPDEVTAPGEDSFHFFGL